VDIDYRATVDRNGAIHIPQIGSLTVGGLRYQDLHGYMRAAISRVFRNFDLNVNLGQLRSVQVFVVGHARRPGAYTVSSLSTLVNALFASGGPSTRGSMRNIQLKRGETIVTTFDVYDLLLKGDKSKDVRLLPGDVIYIPPVGQLVAIAGSVNQPAIYELKSGTSLNALIELAGGLSAVAAGQKVKIERIAERRTRMVDEFDLDRAGLARTVQDGDVVQLYALSPRFENAVSVRGSVANPGRFPWREGMRIRDVIPDRESLIVPDYWLRVNSATRPLPSAAVFRPAEALSRSAEAANRSTEAAAARSPDAGARPGEGAPRPADAAQRPPEPRAAAESRPPEGERGRFEMKRLFDEINWDYATIERLNPNDLTTLVIPFNLGAAVLEGESSQNLPLRPGDIVTIYSRTDMPVPVAKQTQFVKLEGEVRTPGVYQLRPGETLRQLVTRIGGFTPSAYLYASEFTRESVRLQQQRRIDESIERLSQETERGAAGRAQAATADQAGTIQSTVEAQRRLIERLREARASGRIVLEVTPDRTELRDLPELSLQDGDRFFVPSKPSTVAVIGSVYNQAAFVHDPGKRLADYLEMAGGLTRGADKGRTYLVRADGTVTGRAQSSLFNPFTSEKLNPGDTVVVPENLERFFLTKELRDWTQIFYQFALGVAALKVLRDF
jgi:protein involved in polysaccharide export with SLBB domain